MSQTEQAKQPVTRLAGPYGHPVHPALLAVTLAFAVGLLIRTGHLHAPVPAGPLALSAVALPALAVSGYLGRVTGETTQAEGYRPPARTAGTRHV